jgi:hypothetical protein
MPAANTLTPAVKAGPEEQTDQAREGRFIKQMVRVGGPPRQPDVICLGYFQKINAAL